MIHPLEIFLKTLLRVRIEASDEQLKGLSHNLERLLDRVKEIDAGQALLELKAVLGYFPSIGARYTGAQLSYAQLWSAYRAALFAGAGLMRSWIGTRIRPAVADAYDSGER